MPDLVFGQEITAADVEDRTSDWAAERFARLCNAVLFALAWRDRPGKPAFTERVNVADNGIDAEMQLNIKADSVPVNTSFLREGIRVCTHVIS